MIEPSENEPAPDFVVFAGMTRIATGTLAEAAVAAKQVQARTGGAPVLVFDAVSGRVCDLDLRGTETEIAARYAPPPRPAPGPGRPKLGVVAREVTLLPRHWDWLGRQPGGASVALRKLVEAARKAEGDVDAARARIEAAYRFMSALAGDIAGFEEAARALFARDRERLGQCIRGWPPDVADQTLRYLEP